MKWIDEQIAKKMQMSLLIKFYKTLLKVLKCVITFDLCQWHFHFFALFWLSISEASSLSVSVALGLSICFTGNSFTTDGPP